MMKKKERSNFPFKKKWISAAGHWLELVQAILFLSFGIFTLVNGNLAFRFLQLAAAGGLVIAGIARFFQMMSEKKVLWAVLWGLGFAVLAALVAVYPVLFAVPVGLVFGLWFVVSGLARGAIAIQCWS